MGRRAAFLRSTELSLAVIFIVGFALLIATTGGEGLSDQSLSSFMI